MFFVLYGHLVNDWSTYYVFTSPIKIPLFFAITGYVFKTREGDFKRFLKNLCLTLVVPWVFLSLMPVKILYRLIRFNFSGVAGYFVNFISGRVYWYMPCCIIAEIIFLFF